MIGLQTTFYGYPKPVLGKVKKVIGVFESLDMPAYTQIGPTPAGEEFEMLVSELNNLKNSHEVDYSVHQSIWLPSPDFFLNLGSSDETVKKGTLNSLKRSIDFARRIGAKNVSFHAGCAANKVTQDKEFEPLRISDAIPYEEAYSNVRETLKNLLSYAKRDIKLSVENLNYRADKKYLFSTPEDFRRLPRGVNVLFDTGHAYFSGARIGDPSYFEKMIGAIGGKITEIHASDNDGSEDQHMLAGFGKVPFSKIFDLIAKKQKLPPVVIEAVQAKHGYSEDDLRKSIGALANLLGDV